MRLDELPGESTAAFGPARQSYDQRHASHSARLSASANLERDWYLQTSLGLVGSSQPLESRANLLLDLFVLTGDRCSRDGEAAQAAAPERLDIRHHVAPLVVLHGHLVQFASLEQQ